MRRIMPVPLHARRRPIGGAALLIGAGAIVPIRADQPTSTLGLAGTLEVERDGQRFAAVASLAAVTPRPESVAAGDVVIAARLGRT
jgi:hypothetical protein